MGKRLATEYVQQALRYKVAEVEARGLISPDYILSARRALGEPPYFPWPQFPIP